MHHNWKWKVSSNLSGKILMILFRNFVSDENLAINWNLQHHLLFWGVSVRVSKILHYNSWYMDIVCMWIRYGSPRPNTPKIFYLKISWTNGRIEIGPVPLEGLLKGFLGTSHQIWPIIVTFSIKNLFKWKVKVPVAIFVKIFWMTITWEIASRVLWNFSLNDPQSIMMSWIIMQYFAECHVQRYVNGGEVYHLGLLCFIWKSSFWTSILSKHKESASDNV